MAKKRRVHRVCQPDERCAHWSVRWGRTIVCSFPCGGKKSARGYAKRAKAAMGGK
ncbi:MAG: hypothetical protein OXC11_08630 [Rhodospirillales bacterium]|nr:hypothetical protein [Rhodospirillales bacterium]